MTITNEQVAKTGKVEIAQLSRQKEGGGGGHAERGRRDGKKPED